MSSKAVKYDEPSIGGSGKGARHWTASSSSGRRTAACFLNLDEAGPDQPADAK